MGPNKNRPSVSSERLLTDKERLALGELQRKVGRKIRQVEMDEHLGGAGEAACMHCGAAFPRSTGHVGESAALCDRCLYSD